MNNVILEVLKGVKGCSLVGITYTTVEKLPKKLGLGVVTRQVKGVVLLGASLDYERIVNKRRAKEGKEPNFQALALPWGEWTKGFEGLLLNHKGKDYVRFYCLNNKLKSSWFEDGEQMSQERIEIVKAYKKGLAKSSRQAIENELVVRSIDADNITSITLQGVTTIANYCTETEKVSAK